MTISRIVAGGRTPPELRRARLATATLFFANGCGLGSWLPHIPDVKIDPAGWPPAGRGGGCLSLYASALLLVLIGG